MLSLKLYVRKVKYILLPTVYLDVTPDRFHDTTENPKRGNVSDQI